MREPRNVSSELSQDSIFAGRLRLWQPARGAGYRFNLDPVLLAGFAGRGAHAVDLGAGCGVLGLALLTLGKAERLTAVEIQPELADLVRRNAEENGLAARAKVIAGDVRALASLSADLVVFNPPYFRAEHGRGAATTSRDTARHERHGGLADFVAAAVKCLTAEGRVAAIIPIARAEELVAAFAAQGAAPTRRREIRARRDVAPGHMLLECALTRTDLVDEPPLVVHRDGVRDYTDEVEAWVRGG